MSDEPFVRDPPIAEAFVAIIRLAEKLGVKSIKDLPGLWELAIDEHWKIRVNGHKEEIDAIPPFHCAVEFNGWPAGLFSPQGGVIAAGDCANERTFIEACERRTSAL